MTSESAHATPEQSPPPAPLTRRFRLSYGTGAILDGLTNGALNYFLLFYLTSVCGLSGTAAGAALLVGLLVDAVADPFIGLLSDTTRSKLGRRYPFMLWSTLPVAILFGLLFSIPSSLSGFALLAYASVCAMALRLALSCFNLPYLAVGAEVTEDYHQRSQIVAYRMSINMAGTFLGIGLGLGVFMSGPNGLSVREAYVPYAWTCAVILAGAGFLSAQATRSALWRLKTAPARSSGALAGFLTELGEIARNRSFVILFLAVTAFFVAQGLASALALYLFRNFWHLPSSTIQMLLIAATLGPIVGVPIAALLLRWLDKKIICIASFFVVALAMGWPPLARIAGVVPSEGEAIVTVLAVNALLSGAGMIAAAVSAQSMMADAVDEHEHRFGFRREGLFFAGLTLAGKAALGLGGFLAGAALDLIDFPIAAANGEGRILAAGVERNLGLIAGPLPALVTLLAPLALLGYVLTREKHAQLLAALKQRRAQHAPS